MIKDVINSIKTTVEDRLTESVMYGTFVVSWCIWNWGVLYITIFVGQDLIFQKTNLLKVDYIAQQYSWNGWWWFLSFSRLLVFPILSTFLIIWGLSIIDFKCFSKHQKNIALKENEALRIKESLLIKEQKVLERREKNVGIEKKIQKEMTNEDRWNIEYSSVKDTASFQKALIALKECLYQHSGTLDDSYGFRMASDTVAYLDVNDLIEFNKNSRNDITATDKGKYFLKKYIQGKA